MRIKVGSGREKEQQFVRFLYRIVRKREIETRVIIAVTRERFRVEMELRAMTYNMEKLSDSES